MYEDGYFYLVDRKKDYLRRRGRNISSFELERAFRGHPDIVDVAIHSVLSESAEDDVKATIVLNGASKMTEAEMCSWCEDQDPSFAVPRSIQFPDELPRNPVGRVHNYQLRAEGWPTPTWDRENAAFALAKR